MMRGKVYDYFSSLSMHVNADKKYSRHSIKDTVIFKLVQ